MYAYIEYEYTSLVKEVRTRKEGTRFLGLDEGGRLVFYCITFYTL